MRYRIARSNEADTIALLHATSWKTAYRGILSDDYLDNGVLNNRLAVWRMRFENRAKNQFIYIAFEGKTPKGFVCVLGAHDEKWGALVDNLHVLPDTKRQGVGKRLMQAAAKWVARNYPQSCIYLWVYADNKNAIHFYEKIGGKRVESEIHEGADGSFAEAYRYVWTDIEILLKMS